MQEEYKGFVITYCEWSKTFSARIDESTYDNEDLSKVKKHIDDLDKIDFERVPVIICDWGEKFMTGTLTSEFIEENETYAWVTKQKNGRSKLKIKELFKNSRKNVDIVTQINSLIKKRDDIDEDIETIKTKMEKYESQLNPARTQCSQSNKSLNLTNPAVQGTQSKGA